MFPSPLFLSSTRTSFPSLSLFLDSFYQGTTKSPPSPTAATQLSTVPAKRSTVVRSRCGLQTISHTVRSLLSLPDLVLQPSSVITVQPYRPYCLMLCTKPTATFLSVSPPHRIGRSFGTNGTSSSARRHGRAGRSASSGRSVPPCTATMRWYAPHRRIGCRAPRLAAWEEDV